MRPRHLSPVLLSERMAAGHLTICDPQGWDLLEGTLAIYQHAHSDRPVEHGWGGGDMVMDGGNRKEEPLRKEPLDILQGFPPVHSHGVQRAVCWGPPEAQLAFLPPFCFVLPFLICPRLSSSPSLPPSLCVT